MLINETSGHLHQGYLVVVNQSAGLLIAKCWPDWPYNTNEVCSQSIQCWENLTNDHAVAPDNIIKPP